LQHLALIAPGDPPDSFPDPAAALVDPPGLLCAGGDLSPARLLAAYRRGIFPWFEQGQPILWWSPDPRAVLYVSELRISRSLRRTLRSGRYRTSIDADFPGVVRGCAATRGRDDTWITPAMEAAYRSLHALGHAHSVETWEGDTLVGGLYGVCIGRVFFGESMFAARTDASKVALARLVQHLATLAIPLVDCQVASPHLASLGSRLLPREQFLAQLSQLVDAPAASAPWGSGPMDSQALAPGSTPAPLRG
jgi:leucyl/phenylalanyl-tRNA--protein transferase